MRRCLDGFFPKVFYSFNVCVCVSQHCHFLTQWIILTDVLLFFFTHKVPKAQWTADQFRR